MTNKKKPTTYRVGFHDYLILQRIIGGKCKFRTCDPCSVNAVLYP